MKFVQESIFVSALRALCVAFFSILGIGCAFIPVIFILALVGGSGSHGPNLPPVIPTPLPTSNWEEPAFDPAIATILQIDIEGVIGSELLNAETVISELKASRRLPKNNQVRAILLNIDTPGGGVVDTAKIFRSIKDYSKEFEVPVYAFVDGACFSGGMYLACAAEKIYTTDTSIVGSVGVIFPPFMNFSTLMERVGVGSTTISAGVGKDSMNPLRPWGPNEASNLTEIVDFSYEQFVKVVLSGRPNMDRTDLIQKYGAHIYPSPIAQRYGYVDFSDSTRGDALDALAVRAGIKDGNYQVVSLRTRNWFDQFLSSQSPLRTGKLSVSVPGILDIPARLSGEPLYLYAPMLSEAS